MKTNSVSASRGVALLAKRSGVTSFSSLSLLKRNLGTKKIGHTGTLDKFADGLLLVLVGSFTRLNVLSCELDKQYLATFCFGKTTPTLDPESPVSGVGRLPTLSEIEGVLFSFKGLLSQEPPMFSAVHLEGQRAYLRALKGEEFRLPPRRVTIYDLNLLSYERGFLTLRVSCSKGTYIRSLARDLALALESVAYVSQLRREKVGPFSLSSALPAEEIGEASLLSASSFLTSLGVRFSRVENPLPFLRGQDPEKFLRQEGIIDVKEGYLALLTLRGELLALLQKTGERYSYVFSSSLI